MKTGHAFTDTVLGSLKKQVISIFYITRPCSD